VNKVVELAATNAAGVTQDKMSYREQIQSAFSVNGGNLEEAVTSDFVFHFIIFFWKVLFAFIPPPHIGGGWPCFVLSLVAIGFLTAIIGDLASVFGCLVGLNDNITGEFK